MADITTTSPYKTVKQYLPTVARRTSDSRARRFTKGRVRFFREATQDAPLELQISDRSWMSGDKFASVNKADSYWKLTLNLPPMESKNHNLARSYANALLVFLGLPEYKIVTRKGKPIVRELIRKKNTDYYDGINFVIPAGIITNREGT
jgi:hypothetical protein